MVLAIATPEKKIMEEECVSATLPTSEGQITVLPGHMPLFALLTHGEVTLRNKDGEEKILVVGEGFINLSEDKIILLTDFGVNSDEIDEEEIKKARARAEELLKNKTDQNSMAEAQASLSRSILQLKAITKKKRH